MVLKQQNMTSTFNGPPCLDSIKKTLLNMQRRQASYRSLNIAVKMLMMSDHVKTR